MNTAVFSVREFYNLEVVQFCCFVVSYYLVISCVYWYIYCDISARITKESTVDISQDIVLYV